MNHILVGQQNLLCLYAESGWVIFFFDLGVRSCRCIEVVMDSVSRVVVVHTCNHFLFLPFSLVAFSESGDGSYFCLSLVAVSLFVARSPVSRFAARSSASCFASRPLASRFAAQSHSSILSRGSVFGLLLCGSVSRFTARSSRLRLRLLVSRLGLRPLASRARSSASRFTARSPASCSIGG